MRLPTLYELPTSRDLVDAFGGYNHNLRIGSGEFYDMKNLTSSYYPVLSPRAKRGTYVMRDADGNETVVENVQGLIAKDALCYVANGKFYINDYAIDDSKMALGVSCATCPNAGSCTKYNADNHRTTFCEKTLISMGAFVVIMPDKKYINTAELTDFGSLEASVTTQGKVDFELCKLDGSDFGDVRVSATAPTITDEMKEGTAEIPLWLDTSGDTHVLKIYATTTSQWTSVATTYIKISSPGIGKPFNVEDGVTIADITANGVTDLNNTMVIWGKGDDYIIVTGILDQVTSQETPITIKRQIPHMDYIVECNNRLWGCRYGVAVNGNVVNEIYCSKLGDFKNWNTYAGISTDSYAVTVGTDGQFTGAITHMGYPIFFKENCMHKVYGYYPANYQVQTTACRGVQKGCEKSLAIVNEVLFYKSQSAICGYDGSLPTEISSAFGDVNYSNAVAGTIGNKYYVSMADASGAYHLFVYDTKMGVWHREDNTKASQFCTCRGELYYIDIKSNGKRIIRSVNGSGSKDSGDIEWMAETGIMGVDDPDKKYISRIDVRLSLEVGARVFFMIQYDSLGAWEHLFTMTGANLKSFSIPIRPMRCDHLRLRIEGIGEAKIYSISKTIEQGSEV